MSFKKSGIIIGYLSCLLICFSVLKVPCSGCGWYDSSQLPFPPPPEPPPSASPPPNDCPPESCCPSTSYPVYPASGKETYSVPIMTVPGGAVPIQMTGNYDSSHRICGPLGYGWTHDYQMRLFERADNKIVVRTHTHNDTLFTKSSGIYIGPDWSTDELEYSQAPDCGTGQYCYILSKLDGTRYYFTSHTDSDGKYEEYVLTRVEDRMGNGLTFTYEDELSLIYGLSSESHTPQESIAMTREYHLSSIADDVGHVLEFSYIESPSDWAGRISQVVEKFQNVECRKTYFIYNEYDGNLQAVKRWVGNIQGGGERTVGYYFEYDDDNHLTTVTRTMNTSVSSTEVMLFRNIYDEEGRCTEQKQYRQCVEITGDRFDYSYLPLRTIMTQPDNSRIITDFTENKRPYRVQYDMGTPDDLSDDIIIDREYGDDPGCPICKQRIIASESPHYLGENGLRTEYEYNSEGQLTKRIVDPDSSALEWTYTYNTAGDILSIEPPSYQSFDGYVYDYNANGLLYHVYRKDTSGNSVLESTYTYTGSGQIATVTNAAGKVTTYTYYSSGNGKGQLQKITYPSNGNQENPYVMFTYDGRGNLESRTDRSGSSSTRVFYEYDGIDRITRVTYPSVNGYTPEETYEYDLYDSVGKCFVSRHTDINGVVTETLSDEAGNMRVTKIDGDVVEERDYDVMDRVVKVTDARENSTSYYYDGMGRKWAVEYHWVSSESDFSNPSEIYRYRADGKLESVTDGDDNATGYMYDDLGRLMRKDYNDGSYIAYEYVGDGELVSKITDSKDGKEISYTYDTLRRVNQISTTRHGYAVQYTYTSLDQVSVAQSGSLFNYSYEYYDDGSMKRIHDNINNNDYDISYYRSGLRSQMNRPYSLKTDYTYDVLGRLQSVEHSRNQVSLQKFEYTYDVDMIDGSGNPLYKGYRTERSLITSGGTVDQQYAYNERGWLTRSKYVGSYEDEFLYDATGNRTQKLYKVGGNPPVTTNYGVDARSDRIVSVNGSYGLEWSKGGRLQSDAYAGREYVYGDRGNLDRVNVTGTSYYTEFRYDGSGDRWYQYRTVSGQTITRSFLYDREDVAVDFNGEYGTVKTVYVNGPGIDEVLSVRVGGVLYPVLHDGLGSVTGLMNSSGSLVNTYNYKAYGESLSTTGSLENRYRYTNREYVESGSNGTELYYYRARYYRPDLGRFTSKDPMGMIDGTNMFVYVQNSPVEWIDPYGLWFGIDDVFTGPVDEIIVICALGKCASDAWNNLRNGNPGRSGHPPGPLPPGARGPGRNEPVPPTENLPTRNNPCIPGGGPPGPQDPDCLSILKGCFKNLGTSNPLAWILCPTLYFICINDQMSL